MHKSQREAHLFAYVDPTGKILPTCGGHQYLDTRYKCNLAAVWLGNCRSQVVKFVYIGTVLMSGNRSTRQLNDERWHEIRKGGGLYNFETGMLTDDMGVQYKNGERVE